MTISQRCTKSRVLALAAASLFSAVLPFAAATAASASVQPTTPAVMSAHSLSSVVFSEMNSLRAKFHLVTGKQTTMFQSEVNAAAAGLRDPSFNTHPAGVVSQLGVWGAISSTDATQLSAPSLVDTWVYHDGWEGASTENIGCTSPSSSGCNDHRRYVLSGPPQKGATLTIDVAVVSTTVGGNPALSIAAILAWTAPKK